MTSPRGIGRRTAGLSMIELLIVLAIIALASGTGFSLLEGSTSEARLRAAGRKLAGVCALVRSAAISRQLPCRLELDFDRHRFRYIPEPNRDEYGRAIDAETFRIMGNDQFVAWDHGFTWEDLPKDVFLLDLTFSAKEMRNGGVVQVEFPPDGNVPAFIIHVKTPEGSIASVSMNGLTGSAESSMEFVKFPDAVAGDFTNVMGSKPPGGSGAGGTTGSTGSTGAAGKGKGAAPAKTQAPAGNKSR